MSWTELQWFANCILLKCSSTPIWQGDHSPGKSRKVWELPSVLVREKFRKTVIGFLKFYKITIILCFNTSVSWLLLFIPDLSYKVDIVTVTNGAVFSLTTYYVLQPYALLFHHAKNLSALDGMSKIRQYISNFLLYFPPVLLNPLLRGVAPEVDWGWQYIPIIAQATSEIFANLMTFMEVSEISRFLAVRLTVKDHNGFHGLVDGLTRSSSYHMN
jgi:hypothetical protein